MIKQFVCNGIETFDAKRGADNQHRARHDNYLNHNVGVNVASRRVTMSVGASQPIGWIKNSFRWQRML